MFVLALPLFLLGLAPAVPAPLVAVVGGVEPVPVAAPAAASEASDLALDVEAALDQLHRGRRLEAQDALISALMREVQRGAALAPRRAAEAEVGALLLAEVVRQLESHADVGPILRSQRPWPRNTPPRLAYLLDRLIADCWRRVGRPDHARGLLDQQGLRNDWWLIGPFDNERGSGFDVAYPPEQAFVWDEPLPGKEREVRWRRNRASPHPLGVVELHSMLRPRSQAVAYAASSLQMDGAGPLVLRLGSTGAYKVFLNGEEVARRDVERPLVDDQERILLHLREGRNQLLLKLAVEDGPWAFVTRFTRPDGAPADDLIMDAVYTSWPVPAPSVDAGSLLLYMFPDAHDELGITGLSSTGGGTGDAPGAAMGGGGPGGEGAAHQDAGASGDASQRGGLVEHGDEDESEGGQDGADLAARFAAFQGEPGVDELIARLTGQVPAGPWPDPVPAAERVDVALAPEAPDLLDALTDDASAQRLAALYHELVHPDERGNLAMRRAAERAVELEPDSTLGWYLLARSHEADGRDRSEIAVNDRLAALAAVLERDPQHLGALLDLARFSLRDAPRPERADELSRRAVEAAPESWNALLTRVAVLESQGRRAEGEALRRRAEDVPEAESLSEALVARAVRELHAGRREAYDAALMEGFRRNVLSRRLADRAIEASLDQGDAERALWITEQVLNARPVDTDRMRRTAKLMENGEPLYVSRARELVMRALDACLEEPRAWTHLARLALRSDMQPLALHALDKALELDPSLDLARHQLELITAEQREAFELPFRWDAVSLMGTPLPTEGGEPLEVLRRTVVWRVHEDGTEHEYRHLAVRVLSEGGARTLDRYRVAAPGAHDLDVLTLRVLRADGTLEPVPAPRRRRGTARNYDLPQLGIGDVVDVEYRADQHRADVFGEYFGQRLGFFPDRIDATAPTRHSELILLAPPQVPLHVAERNAEGLERETSTTADGLVLRKWTARDLARPPIESGMPKLVELVPVIDVTTFADWDAFARWWWSFIEKEFVTTPQMSAKVQQLVAGASSELEAIEAITRFVGQDIRYNAWAFGTHGYEPYSAATIFDRRFGDCKDKSILLRQMLAEIDVEAWPVLIRAEYNRADEPLGAAMVGAFNHCIAYLPATDERPGMYLDATADRNPIEYLRADDQGARVLHVGPDGGELHDIPYAPPANNALRREYLVRLAADGSAEVELVDRSNGAFAVRLRSLFGGEQGDLPAMLGRELSEAFGQIDVLDVRTSELDDIREPIQLDVRFSTRDLAVEQGPATALPIVFDDLGLPGLADESAEKRRHELVIDRPMAHEQHLVYELPEGARVLQLVEQIRIEVPGLLDYTLESERVDGGVAVRRAFQLYERRIPLDRYAEFRDAVQRVRQAEARRLLIDLEGPE